MTIVYCDYTSGDDSTGDGSAGSPYKTITKASTGLTGGDEVRCAKSPANTALTGTLSFTNGSATVTGDSTLFTSELAVGDLIKGGDDFYYDVVTITSDTELTIYKVYAGDNESGVSSEKMGVTDTGIAVSSGTQVQVISASGSSSSSLLKISGGWDLSTETQTGVTNFKQTHSTIATKNGYGLYSSNKVYLEISNITFSRYNYGVYYSSSKNSILHDLYSYGNNNYGFYFTNFSNKLYNIYAMGNNYGIFLNGTIIGDYGEIYDSNFSGNNYGTYISNTYSNLVISGLVCNNNDYGLYLSGSYSTDIINYSASNNINGIYIRYFSSVIVNKLSFSNNTSDIVRNSTVYSDPYIKIQHFNTAGDNRCYYEGGITYRNTTDSRSTQCLQYEPISATKYISQSFYFKADSGVEKTLYTYIKDDADFDGDVQAAIYFMGEKITGWTEWTPTTSYAQQSIVASAGDITEDGVLELRIKVRGTDGNVFVDDLSST